MSIKGIVFLTFWQGLLIPIIFNLNFQSISTSSVATPAASVPAPIAPMMAPSFAPTHFSCPVVPCSSGTAAGIPPPAIPPSLAPTSIEGATIDVLPESHPTFGCGPRRRKLNDEQDDDGSQQQRATPEQVQNLLICLEMLFFSIAHWCVFPAEEWAPDYRPQQHIAKPGMGLKDFASDISYIMSSSSTARRYRRGKSRLNSDGEVSQRRGKLKQN